MRFIFWHHEAHGPIDLQELWDGTHGYGGSVARLRVLFWIAARNHEVILAGNVRPGLLRGVRAIPGTDCLMRDVAQMAGSAREILILNNPPSESLWRSLRSHLIRPVVFWAGNPIDPYWLEEARNGALDRIVCVSQYHRELYRIYPGFKTVEVCYTGTDMDILNETRPNPEAEGAVVFCSVPRRTKGFHNLLRAWRLVRKTLPDARLRVCGSALMHDPQTVVGWTGHLDRDIEEEFPDLFTSPDQLKRFGISLLGGRKDLHAVYAEIKAAAVAVVNCNWRGSYETFCRAAVEAQAAGTPVIGASRGSLPEVVANGATGLLVSGSDPAFLAEAITKLLKNKTLRESMKTAGPAWARQFADYDEVARDWEDIAKRGLSGETPPISPRWKGDWLRRIGYGRARAGARALFYDCKRGFSGLTNTSTGTGKT